MDARGRFRGVLRADCSDASRLPPMPKPPQSAPPRSAQWPLAARVRWVRAFRALIVRELDALCAAMEGEVAKTRWEAMTSDLLPLLASCRWHERRAPRLLRPKPVRGRAIWQVGQRVRLRREPIGRVAIIATWNYPVQLLGIQLVQAVLAGSERAGNRVVVKPSERCPRTQALLLDLAEEAGRLAGMPPGVIERAPATREAGAELLDAPHPGGSQPALWGRFDHVVFTGSTEVGRRVASALAGPLTPSTLELSGRDSAFVLPGADAALAARSIWAMVLMNAGQTCMAPRRAIVVGEAWEPFVGALKPLIEGSSPVSLIDEAAAERVRGLVAGATQPVIRGREASADDPRLVTPTAVLEADPAGEVAGGAHFGPLLAVVRCATLDEAVAAHALCDQHLATSIYPPRGRGGRASAEALVSKLGERGRLGGSVTIMDTVLPTAQPGASIAGHGASGWGASRGAAGLLAMTRAVHVSTTSPRVRTPLGEPPAKQQASFERFVRWWYGLGGGLKHGARPAPKTDEQQGDAPARRTATAAPRATGHRAHATQERVS
ncbi:MAG: aldehyde dehydrogenase family protein [Phycisphaerales bacterium]|nr:MAG: aldehyde dehydrogenase family protein [Phycisphaerales bacterium]